MSDDLSVRVEALDWQALATQLNARGFTRTGPLLSAQEASDLADLFDREPLFRRSIVMQRHGYGAGRYRYFDYPLPESVESLRQAFYRQLAPIAQAWAGALGLEQRYPAELADYLALCHAAGQTKATPLVLRYGPGDYNRLHQDLYGALSFPIQVVFLLSDPERDFEGGELVLSESRARMQSRAQVLRPSLGEAVLFANSLFPVAGRRGAVRAQLRHGVSDLTKGERTTLGLIFHDAA